MSVGSPVPTSFPYMFPRASKTQPWGSMLPCGGWPGSVPRGIVAKPGQAVWKWRFRHVPSRAKTPEPAHATGRGPRGRRGRAADGDVRSTLGFLDVLLAPGDAEVRWRGPGRIRFPDTPPHAS